MSQLPSGGNMTKVPLFEPVFQRLIDDPVAALDQVRNDPQSFEGAVIEEERGMLRNDAAIPSLATIAALVFDAHGTVAEKFGPDWMPDVASFAELEARTTIPSRNPHMLSIRGRGGGMLHLVWALSKDAADWNLPGSVRDALARNPSGRIALSVSGAEGTQALQDAARSYGLSGLEQRVVVAVVRAGSGRAAAAAIGLSYPTVREALWKASHRMNVANLPALVKKLVAAAFGVLPGDHDGPAVLAEMLPLNARQATIALMIADGLNRAETARALRVSLAVVKKELEVIFAVLGIGTAAELARLVVEVRALRLFARSTDGALGFFDPAIEPTRFLSRDNDREIIAWSDYGPASGRPVLIVHSNWSCRAVPRPLLIRLQAAGWRPIAIDRPGFGSTHIGSMSRDDPFSQAIADTIQVIDRLRIDRVAIISRCGAQFTAALKEAQPDRIGPVVLVSPSPPTTGAGRRHGVVGVIKEAFYRSPRLIDFYFRVICAQLTLARTERLTRAIVAGSAGDEKLCDDDQFIRDRFRAIRPFSTGNLAGAVMEERVISSDSFPVPRIDARDWLIVQGGDDVQFDVDEVVGYWSPLIPHARVVTVADGGRFMTSSHAPLVVDLLDELLDLKGRVDERMIPPGNLSRPARWSVEGEPIMSSETGNAQAREENRGSSGPNQARQEDESRDPNKSNARDRTGRKGGDNAENL